jgi:tRNA threonylcarbamoyl adenosine modification protein (Sua5/YciO/YrdC/YwlC family)
MLHLYIHPDSPQDRIIQQAVARIRQGAVVIYPADTTYALGCQIGDKGAMERIARIRRLSEQHQYTLICRDLSEISTYAKVDNATYRLLKNHTPGLYTFILTATSEVPKRLLHPKRKTIGIRVPTNPVSQALLEALGEPMLTTTLTLPDATDPLDDPYDIEEKLEKLVDVFIDVGTGTLGETSVIDLSGDKAIVVRVGLGDVSAFG